MAAARPRRRTSTSAQPTPKIVFSGTAIAAIRTDSQSALIAAGVVIQLQAVAKPCSNVRPNTTPTGSTSINPRYRSATVRSDTRARRLLINSAADPTDQDEHHQRQHQQHERERGGGPRGVALDIGIDHDAGDLHLARD